MFSLNSKKSTFEKSVSDFIRNVLNFKPGNIEIYKVAFIHRSASAKDPICGSLNNERLEYLGDAVLGTIVAEYLFKRFPAHREGDLTRMRSNIVCRDNLNSLSRTIGLTQFISYDNNNCPKCAPGDAFEALVGAIFLDKGYLKTKKIIIDLFNTHLDIESVLTEDHNFKSLILNWGRKTNKTIRFEQTSPEWNANRKLYNITVFVDEKNMGQGSDFTIKKAEQAAAAAAWEVINA